MAEFTAVANQTVAANQNALLTNDVVTSKCVSHRSGSGIMCLSGSGNPCNCARYKVFVKANIAIPTGGTVEPISLGIALNGEVLQSSLATVTPAADGDYFAVATEEVICVGKCPAQVSVNNPNTQSISVENLTVIINREC